MQSQIQQEINKNYKVTTILHKYNLKKIQINAISLPSLGGKRRVHNDGLLMLDNSFGLKEAEQKFEIMRNRIERLQIEEQMAIKN